MSLPGVSSPLPIFILSPSSFPPSFPLCYKPHYRLKAMNHPPHLLDVHSDSGTGDFPNSVASLTSSLSQQGAREESVHLVRHFYKVSGQGAGEGSLVCVTDTELPYLGVRTYQSKVRGAFLYPCTLSEHTPGPTPEQQAQHSSACACLCRTPSERSPLVCVSLLIQ